MRQHQIDTLASMTAGRSEYIRTFDTLLARRPFYTAEWSGVDPHSFRRSQVELNGTNYSMSVRSLAHVIEISKASPKTTRSINRRVMQPESLLTLLHEDDDTFTVSQSIITSCGDYRLQEDGRPVRVMDFRIMTGVLRSLIESPYPVLATGSQPPSS